MLTVSFKTRTQVINDIKTQTRLAVGSLPDIVRWTDAEIEFAVNMTIATWGDSVSIPGVTSITGGSDAPVDLPWHINAVEAIYQNGQPVRVRLEQPLWDYMTLELPPGGIDNLPPGAQQITTNLTFPLLNSECITTDMTLAADYAENDETMTLLLAESGGLGETGVIKVDGSWFPFTMEEDAGTTVTINILKALSRGKAPTYPIPSGTVAEAGIVVTSSILWAHMNAYSIALLHSMYSAYGSPTDIETHQWFMRWWDTKATELWGRHKPRPVQGKLLLK